MPPLLPCLALSSAPAHQCQQKPMHAFPSTPSMPPNPWPPFLCTTWPQVLESEYEAQKAVAPFLGNRVLRRIVQTFANDPKGDFAKWALNPEVIQMLSLAKQRMEQGWVAPWPGLG